MSMPVYFVRNTTIFKLFMPWPCTWLDLYPDLTLGDHHCLYGSVVIRSLVIIWQSLWMTQVILWAVVDDSSRYSIEESAHRERLILTWIKGELHPCASAPTRTSREWRLSDISEKHHRISLPFFILSTFEQFNLCLYILKIAMLEYDWNLGCKTFMR
jgi:hypothetical protein